MSSRRHSSSPKQQRGGQELKQEKYTNNSPLGWMPLFATCMLWLWFSKLLQHTPPLLPSWTMSFYGTNVSKTSNYYQQWILNLSQPPAPTIQKGQTPLMVIVRYLQKSELRAQACFHSTSVTSETSQVSCISRETHTLDYHVTLIRIPVPDLTPDFPCSFPKSVQAVYIQWCKLWAVRHILLYNVCIAI